MPVLAQVGPHLVFDGNAGLPDHPLAGVDGDGLVSAILIPRAIGDAQDWRRVMRASGGRAPEHDHCRGLTKTVSEPAPALTSLMTPAATAALMTWWRQ